MTGGNGLDGQTALTALDALELGGTVALELDEVLLNPGSDGVLGGLYTGPTARVHCLAGFNVRQANGNTMITPMLAGVEVGASLTVLAGHAYTLRLRVHCAELERLRQTFYTLVNGAVELFGGDLLLAEAAVVFEVRDAGESSNTPVTVLYEGALLNVVPSAVFAAVDSVQMFGSIGAVRLTRTGTVWMTGTDAATGTPRTLAMGTAGSGVDCGFPNAATGDVTFFSGREPAANELVTMTYRGRARAIARAQDAASVAARSSRRRGRAEPPGRARHAAGGAHVRRLRQCRAGGAELQHAGRRGRHLHGDAAGFARGRHGLLAGGSARADRERQQRAGPGAAGDR